MIIWLIFIVCTSQLKTSSLLCNHMTILKIFILVVISFSTMGLFLLSFSHLALSNLFFFLMCLKTVNEIFSSIMYEKFRGNFRLNIFEWNSLLLQVERMD